MITLTLDLKTSATILGTPEEKLLERLQRQAVEGICLDDDWRMSIFVLARLLSTTPDTLLEYLEDDILGQKIAETEEEELLLDSFCLETPAEAAPTPPDAGRGSPARCFQTRTR